MEGRKAHCHASLIRSRGLARRRRACPFARTLGRVSAAGIAKGPACSRAARLERRISQDSTTTEPTNCSTTEPKKKKKKGKAPTPPSESPHFGKQVPPVPAPRAAVERAAVDSSDSVDSDGYQVIIPFYRGGRRSADTPVAQTTNNKIKRATTFRRVRQFYEGMSVISPPAKPDGTDQSRKSRPRNRHTNLQAVGSPAVGAAGGPPRQSVVASDVDRIDGRVEGRIEGRSEEELDRLKLAYFPNYKPSPSSRKPTKTPLEDRSELDRRKLATDQSRTNLQAVVSPGVGAAGGPPRQSVVAPAVDRIDGRVEGRSEEELDRLKLAYFPNYKPSPSSRKASGRVEDPSEEATEKKGDTAKMVCGSTKGKRVQDIRNANAAAKLTIDSNGTQYFSVSIPPLLDYSTEMPSCKDRMDATVAELRQQQQLHTHDVNILTEHGSLLALMVLPLSENKCGSASFVDDMLSMWSSVQEYPADSLDCALFRGLSLQAYAASVPPQLRQLAWKDRHALPPTLPAEADTCVKAVFEQFTTVSSETSVFCGALLDRASDGGLKVEPATRGACSLSPVRELIFYFGFQQFILQRIAAEQAENRCSMPEKVNNKLIRFANAMVFDATTMDTAAPVAASALSAGKCKFSLELNSMLIQYTGSVDLDKFRLIKYTVPTARSRALGRRK